MPANLKSEYRRRFDVEHHVAFVLEEETRLQRSRQALLENLDSGSSMDEPVVTVTELVPSVVDVAGVLLYLSGTGSRREDASDIVEVETTQKNLHSIALALSSQSPVLLEGPVGAGKTALVLELARRVACDGSCRFASVCVRSLNADRLVAENPSRRPNGQQDAARHLRLHTDAGRFPLAAGTIDARGLRRPLDSYRRH